MAQLLLSSCNAQSSKHCIIHITRPHHSNTHPALNNPNKTANNINLETSHLPMKRKNACIQRTTQRTKSIRLLHLPFYACTVFYSHPRIPNNLPARCTQHPRSHPIHRQRRARASLLSAQSASKIQYPLEFHHTPLYTHMTYTHTLCVRGIKRHPHAARSAISRAVNQRARSIRAVRASAAWETCSAKDKHARARYMCGCAWKLFAFYPIMRGRERALSNGAILYVLM